MSNTYNNVKTKTLKNNCPA